MSVPTGVVALLFTDLVGSTKLLERLGDVAAEELRTAHFALLRHAVAEAGGEEVKSTGDGLMVAFASPVEAVGCAVAIQRAVEEQNRAHPDQALGVRVGVQVGEPVRTEGDYHGLAVNVAKRLCDRAAGGQILTTELVAGLVGPRGTFRFRSAGRLVLKGVARPVAAAAVEWKEAAPGEELAGPLPARRARPRPPGARGLRLVGRDQELAFLEAELERAAAGEFRCVLMVADPGVGKTRLGAELLARHPEVLGLFARAYPLGGTASFGLWAEALDRHLRGLAPEEVRELCGGFLDDLAALVRAVAAVRGSVPERQPARSGLLEALSITVANLARREPVVVVLDDVHWADASSWEALRYLADSVPDAPVLVLALARPAELAEQQSAAEVLLGLEQDELLSRLPLRLLDRRTTAELAEAVLGRPPPEALVDWLVERALGNPLFALGLLRALLAEGADLSAPALRSLPEALADRVLVRVKALDEPATDTLEALALLGSRVELADLVRLSGRPLDDLGSVLDALVRSRLVVEEERGAELAYEVAHPLVAETIYQSLGGARRRALHRRVGRALLASGRLGEAAPHFARSGDVGDPEAVDALREALAQAEGREAYREALTILSALVDLLPEGDERWVEVADAMSLEAVWVAEHRADVLAVVGARALRAIDAVLEASPERYPDPLRRAGVKFRLGVFLGWGTGEAEAAERHFWEALAAYREAGDTRRMLLAANELAWMRGLKGDLEALELGGAETLVEPGPPGRSGCPSRLWRRRPGARTGAAASRRRTRIGRRSSPSPGRPATSTASPTRCPCWLSPGPWRAGLPRRGRSSTRRRPSARLTGRRSSSSSRARSTGWLATSRPPLGASRRWRPRIPKG